MQTQGRCTYMRTRRKRGKPPKSIKSYQTIDDMPLGSHEFVYPILLALDQIPFSLRKASKLLNDFYEYRGHELTNHIIRRTNLLVSQPPRKTSKALLLSMLCLACYRHPFPALENMGEAATSRSRLLDLTVQHVNFGNSKIPPTFDDVHTFLNLGTIGTCENSLHQYIPLWLHTALFMARQLKFSSELVDADEEVCEERRR